MVSASFGITTAGSYEQLVALIDSELNHMDWYIDNRHFNLALSPFAPLDPVRGRGVRIEEGAGPVALQHLDRCLDVLADDAVLTRRVELVAVEKARFDEVLQVGCAHGCQGGLVILCHGCFRLAVAIPWYHRLPVGVLIARNAVLSRAAIIYLLETSKFIKMATSTLREASQWLS